MMLTTIFTTVAGMSCLASVMIVLVFILRRFARLLSKGVRRQAFVILWMVVMIRLCVPLMLDAELVHIVRSQPAQYLYAAFFPQLQQERTDNALPFSWLPGTLVEDQEIQIQTVATVLPADTAFAGEKQRPLDQLAAAGVPTETAVGVSAASLLAAIWFIGFLCCLLRWGVPYLMLLRQAAALPPVTALSYEQLLALQQRAGINGKVRICRSDGLLGTAVYGIRRPIIVLSEEQPENLEHILLHELVHIKHHDNSKRLLTELACSIHWFNPLVWLGRRCLYLDMEMACDEKVLSLFAGDERKSYANTLYLEAKKGQLVTMGGVSAFGRNPVSKRVQNILNFRRKSPMLSVVAATVITFLVLGCFSNPMAKAAYLPLQESFIPLQLSLGNHEEMVDYSCRGDVLYAATVQELASGKKVLRLYAYHLTNGQQKLLYTDDRGLYQITSLRCSEEKLYFVQEQAGAFANQAQTAQIMSYDLRTSAVELLYQPYTAQKVGQQVPGWRLEDIAYGSVYLGGGDGYLCWSEQLENWNGAKRSQIVLWDLAQKKITGQFLINGQQNSFDVLDGYVAWQRDSVDGQTELISYEIASGRQRIVPNQLREMPYSAYSNGRYLVYKEDYQPGAEIIVYDLERNEGQSLWSMLEANQDAALVKKYRSGTWGIKLMGNQLILAGEGPEILLINLSAGKLQRMQENHPLPNGFFWPRANDNNITAIQFADTGWRLFWAGMQV